MLFHFSFYWNEHPSLPAAGHEPAVERGRHHLSRVKFPKSAVAQLPLSVSGLVLRLPLEGRRLLLPEHGRKSVQFQAILWYHRPARFGVQLVFLDSDVRLDLLLPDYASVAARNFGRIDLEHVDRCAR